MNHLQLFPCSELQPYIHSFICVRSQNEWSDQQSFRIIADGNPGLVFQENQSSFLGNSGEILPQLFLHGLVTKYIDKTAINCYSNITVCFQPYGLKSIFGINASELTNSYTDLNAIFKTELTGRLSETNSFNEKVGILSKFLLDCIAKNKKYNTDICFIIKALKTDHTVSFLKNLCLDLKISERSLERIMQSYVGVSPKQFSRISRFQSALNCLYNQPVSRLSDIAYAFHYSDQSHYIREFREFSGLSPKQFVKQSSPIQNFIAKSS